LALANDERNLCQVILDGDEGEADQVVGRLVREIRIGPVFVVLLDSLERRLDPSSTCTVYPCL